MWQNCPSGTGNCGINYENFSVCSVDGNFIPASANSSIPFTYGCGSGETTSSYALTSDGTLKMTDAMNASGTCSSSESENILSVSLMDGSGSATLSLMQTGVSDVTESGSGTWSGATDPTTIFATMGLSVQTTDVAAGQPLPQACTVLGATASATARRARGLHAFPRLNLGGPPRPSPH